MFNALSPMLSSESFIACPLRAIFLSVNLRELKMSESAQKISKRKPPPISAGRPRGIPNKATMNAREAIARLVDENAPRMQSWLDQIAEEQGPLAAWKCLTDVVEYHIPKLARMEVAGDEKNPVVTVSRIELVALK
jgi:hypothetical protein